MWACLSASRLVALLISVTLVTADQQIEYEPCSRDVLRVTLHGVIATDRPCNDTTIDDITSKIVGSVPELSSHVYSVIVCPASVTSSNTVVCLYSMYIAKTRNDTIVSSSSQLTRASVVALQSRYSPIMMEPEYDNVHNHNLRSADTVDDMTESSGSGYYDTASSDNPKLQDWHIFVIAVGIFSIFCSLYTCLMFVVQCKNKSLRLSHVEYPPLPITLDEGSTNFELYPLTPQVSKKIYRLSFKDPPLPVLTNLLNMQNLKTMLDNEDAIKTEYHKLSPTTTSIEHIPEGSVYKNRYVDVLPEPRTRVALSVQNGVPTSDYINANYIRGYKMVSEQYIAAQAPLPETIEDFWRLIWEQRCSTIVMLTNLVENNKVRCYQYWPDERVNRTSVYGELLVTIGKRQTEKDYMVTTFLVQHRDKAVNREIIHFWFTSWPDCGVPETTTPLIGFVQEVRNHQAEILGPILVHCSAGIGRTGVFICFDIGMRQLEETNKVDILQIVSILRQDRGGMVQTLSQYHFVYKLLYDYGCYMQRIGSSYLHQPEEFPNDTSDDATSDGLLETDSQSSLHSDY